MSLPEIDALNEMAQLVGGCNFNVLPPQNRVQVIQLVNQGDLIDKIGDLSTNLDNIDDRLIVLADWFKNSRLYEGR